MKRKRQNRSAANKKSSTSKQVEPARVRPHASLKRNESSSDEEDDEEIPEDEAFNSDDERKYGSFFHNDVVDGGKADENSESSDDNKNDTDDDDEDDENDDDEEEEEEGDGGQYMLDILNRLDTFQQNSEKASNPKKEPGEVMARHVPESQFASSVVPTTGLTLDALLQGLESTKGFFGKDGLQSTMKDLVTSTAVKTTTAPLPKISTDRMQRKLQYEQEQKNLSLWIDAVQEHRTAETLDFTPKERLANLTRETMIDKFEPTTDFEKEIYAAIQQQEAEQGMMMSSGDPDDDNLGSHKLTLEEYKQRRAQLAKMRALLFYHEVRRHHINKIKSKTYRRIRKRQRQRMKESEIEQSPDLANELQEKETLERLKERMTLAHKNTSRWAKRILKRGKSVDVNTRRALSAQLQRGDELRKKMSSVRGQGEGDDDDDDDEDDPNTLIASARKLLTDAERAGDQEAQGIFKLSFMQRGIEKQRERAKDEARQLLLELQANAQAEADDDDNNKDAASEFAAGKTDSPDIGESSGQNSSNKKSKIKGATEKEMDKIITDGKLVVSSLEFGKAASEIAVAGNIEIDLGDSATVELSGSTLAVANKTKPKKVHNVAAKEGRVDVEGAVNLLFSETSKTAKVGCAPSVKDKPSDQEASTKPKKVFNKAVKAGHVDVEGAVNLVLPETSKMAKMGRAPSLKDKPSDQVVERKITSLTQEELVRRAFYSESANEVEDEFAKEKQAMIERDDPNTKQNRDDVNPKAVAGWGCWTGEGAPISKPPRALPKHLHPPERKPLPKRRRQDDKKPNVIINEKRLKKTADHFQIANIPYPYTSREEYERAMTGGIGREWNVTSGFKNLTRPEILTRSGKIIQPISKRAKKVRPAAKF